MLHLNDRLYTKLMCLFEGSKFLVSHRKLRTPRHFYELSPLEICLTTLTGLLPKGVLLDTNFHFYVCNHVTLLDVVQRYQVHQSITKHSVDSYHALTPMSCNVPVHNAMRCATTCLCNATYVMNVIWITQTSQFIMCHRQLY